jgi:hypothetical protein
MVCLSDVVDEPTRKEGGEREFGIHHELYAIVTGLMHERNKSLDD